MKTLLKTILVTVLAAAMLCGCKNMSDDSSPNDKRLVSAVGFEPSNHGMTAFVESVEADGEGKVTPHIIKKEGSDAAALLSLIKADSTRSLSFRHTSVVIFGEGLTKEQTDDILNTLINGGEVPLSVKTVAVKNVDEVFSSRDGGEKSVGYEISDLLEQTAKQLGIGAHSTLYEIKTARMQEVNLYAMPYITAGDTLSFKGMRVFADDSAAAELNPQQSAVYALLRNVFEGGEITDKDGVYKISSAKADITAEIINDKLVIDIAIKSTPESDRLIETVEEAARSYKDDIFGFAEVIRRRYPEVWQKIEGEYEKYFAEAEINVRKG